MYRTVGTLRGRYEKIYPSSSTRRVNARGAKGRDVRFGRVCGCRLDRLAERIDVAHGAHGSHMRFVVFGATGSFSQPANVIGGYAVSTAIGLAIAAVAPTEWWSLGLAVGAALVVMQFLRITHPPGAAYPVIILLTRPDWSFLFFPVLTCSVVLVVCAMLLHFLPPRTAYPLSVQTKGG